MIKQTSLMLVHINPLLLIIYFCMTLTGCTSQQVYDGIQKNRYNDCEKLNEPQREDCQKQYEKPYEDYSRKRPDNN